jgi:hypothetical protein
MESAMGSTAGVSMTVADELRALPCPEAVIVTRISS